MPRQPVETLLTDYSPMLGSADAPVTIVEFSDYLCPYCAKFHEQTFKPLIEHYGDLVQVVYREFPVIGQAYTVEIGLAALCMEEQDKYWEYTDLIWANQTLVREQIQIEGSTILTDYASEVEADMEAFNTCYTERRYMDEINLDLEAGYGFGIRGTPLFYIEGQPLTGDHAGAQPIEVFMQYIDEVLISKGITPPEHPDNISTVPS
jgi:protein-disulfide isomerase